MAVNERATSIGRLAPCKRRQWQHAHSARVAKSRQRSATHGARPHVAAKPRGAIAPSPSQAIFEAGGHASVSGRPPRLAERGVLHGMQCMRRCGGFPCLGGSMGAVLGVIALPLLPVLSSEGIGGLRLEGVRQRLLRAMRFSDSPGCL